MRVPGTQDHRRPEGLALPTEARLVPGPSGGAERTAAAYELVKEKLIKSANYKPREYAGFCSLSDSLQRWRSTRMHLRRRKRRNKGLEGWAPRPDLLYTGGQEQVSVSTSAVPTCKLCTTLPIATVATTFPEKWRDQMKAGVSKAALRTIA